MRNSLIIALVFSLLANFAMARENSSLLYRQGREAVLAGNYGEAKKTFERVIELSPCFSLGHYGLGRLYLITGENPEDAIKHLKLATELDVNMAGAHFYLGMAYLLAGRHVPAIHAFDEAYKRNGSYIESLYNIGAIYDRMGYSAKARLYFARYNREKRKGGDQIFF